MACKDPVGATRDRMLLDRIAVFRESLAGSPYYRNELMRLGLAPGDLRSVHDLVDFPILDRSALQTCWQDLPVLDHQDPEARRIVTVCSSGSTGLPVTIAKDGFDAVYMWAALRFWCAWFGVSLPRRPRVVLLCSLPGGLEYSVRLPLLHDGALHRISLLRDDARARLERVRPSIVLTAPAGLHWLCREPPVVRPLLLLSSAQHLCTQQREQAARLFGAPVVNYYSSTETTQIAWECSLHPRTFHVMVPDFWVESIAGDIVVTRLRPGLVPLLRYRTGDHGEVRRDDCACGYHGWSIIGLAGRHACIFVRPDGAEVDAWQLAWVFKHTPLSDFRVTQASPDCFLVEVAGAANHRALAETRARLAAALGNLGWANPIIDMQSVAAVETRGGKPEAFRSRIGQPPRPPARRGAD